MKLDIGHIALDLDVTYLPDLMMLVVTKNDCGTEHFYPYSF